jgi:hypothetical protein
LYACERAMPDAQTAPLPPLAQLFLDVVLCILPRDLFQDDGAALLRLCMVRKSLAEDMHLCAGGFSLDLHVSARHVAMVSPYPQCHLACFNKWHMQALKRTAARFQSIRSLSIDLRALPGGCNFVSTVDVLDLVFHCIRAGRASQLRISHAVFNAERFTHGLRHLFHPSKDQIVSVHLSHCKLAVNSALLRELASLRNLKSLALDGNRFGLVSLAFPGFSDSLKSLSLAGCSGVRAVLLTKVSKTLRSLVWNDNAMLEAEKPFFMAWIADSSLRSLDVDNCGFHAHDTDAFQAAIARMPGLMALSIARNDCFENIVLWWMYEFWRCGRVPCFFRMNVSNMHICFPDHGSPVFMCGSQFGRIEVIE